MQNELARNITASQQEIQYDAQVKKVLSQKEILAWIMRETLEEYKGMELKNVIYLIEEEPAVSTIPVNPGESNREQISGMPTEDKVPYEGVIYYDIRFHANLPGESGRIRILINVECQKDFHPGYRIETRGVFYTARMISAQLGTEFSIPDYGGIRKVASIWVCMDATRKVGNSISEYRIRKKDIVKGYPDCPEAYDKLSIIVITLCREKDSENELLEMLNTLLNPQMEAEEKKAELKEKFHLKMEGDAGKEIGIMCNLSEYVKEQGIEQAKNETIRRMIEKKKYDYDEIAEIAGVSVDKVREIAAKYLEI